MRVSLLLALAVTAIAQQPRVWEAPLTLPTYELGPADPNPAFLEWQRRGNPRPIYPYPVLDTLTNRRVEKTYHAVYLENEYLRVTVLPELGGKLYAIFDKTAGRDVLYTNHVVKYGLVGIRGAWTSGGIEWNFPDGHTVTTVSPVDFVIRTGPEFAEVVVGDTERIQRMQWAVAIRLRPGKKYVETAITLHNRREVPGRYWFWATAAAPAADDLRFVYPMREAYPHAFWPVFSFPKHNGVDVGTYREVPHALSLFARNSYRDFFGVYYEKSDWGVVHVADHRALPGKKTWTWGHDDAGNIWIEKLTDHDGQYVEFQAGRFETQMEHEFLAPFRSENFISYWYPVRGLGGAWSEANTHGALRVAERVTLSVNERLDNAELVIDGRSRRVNLSPEKPFLAATPAPATEVRLKAQDGRELLRWRQGQPVDGNPDFVPATAPPAGPPLAPSAEQAFLRGLAFDKKSREDAARAAYQEALRHDPGFASAHVALGLSFYRTREYARAADHLTRALVRHRDHGDAHYYLGLVRRAQGRHAEAANELLWCVRQGHQAAAARTVLGEMAIAAGRFEDAVEHLTAAATLKARLRLAIALRLVDRRADARRVLDGVLREVPLDYLALRESGDHVTLWRLLAREPDSVMELALDYSSVGRWDEARAVLEEAIERAGSRPYPMWRYLLGSFWEQAEDLRRARQQYALGQKLDPAYVFPHRPEEILALLYAVATSSSDGRAAYYLGNALAANRQWDEARDQWRAATLLDPTNPVAHRNLARSLPMGDEAIAAFNRAIALAPDDVHLYVERDALLVNHPRRLELLESASAPVKSRSAFVLALASAYADAGRLREAIALLESSIISSGEGESSGLAVYRRALRGLAAEHERTGRYEEAAAAYLKAIEYPRNLGVGRPAMRSHARDLLAAADALEKAGQRERALGLVRRAAEEHLAPPTQPEPPSEEARRYREMARQRLGRIQ